LNLLLLALLGCKPPIDENQAPNLHILSPTQGQELLQSAPGELSVRVRDRDADLDITLSVVAIPSGGGDEVPLSDQTGLAADQVVSVDLAALPADTVRLEVRANDQRLNGVRTAGVDITVNRAPNLPEIALSPDPPSNQDDLVATMTTPAQDPDGDAPAYQWSWSGPSGELATGSVFPAVLPSSLTVPDETYTFTVVVVEAQGGAFVPGGNRVTGSWSLTTSANTAPGAPNPPGVLPAAPSPVDPITCTGTGATDPEGDDLTYDVVWYVESGSNWIEVGTDSVLSPLITRPGDNLRCDVSAFDGDLSGPAIQAFVQVSAGATDLDARQARIVGLDNDQLGLSAAVVQLSEPALVLGGALDTWYGFDRTRLEDGGLDLGTWNATHEVGPVEMGTLAPRVAALPDIDGDMVPDFALSERGVNIGLGTSPQVHVLGSSLSGAVDPQSPGSADLWTLENPSGLQDGFGAALSGRSATGGAQVFVSQVLDGSADTVWCFPYSAFSAGYAGTNQAIAITSDRQFDRFGHLLAVGDFDGDGSSDLAVGANARTDLVHVFDGADLCGGPLTPASNASRITATTEGLDALTAVADITGDEITDLALGRQDLAQVEFFSGASLSGDLGWGTAHARVQGLAGSDLGRSVVVLPDLSGDGTPEVLISGAVSAWVFLGERIALGGTIQSSDADLTVDLSSADSGVYAVGHVDLDSNGRTDVVFADPDATVGGVDQGVAWVVTLPH